MAIAKLYRNGITYAKPGRNGEPEKRGKTKGWTPAVSRRMTQWLYSVSIPKLSGNGYSFTFTVKDCPPRASDWSKIIDNMTKRLRRMGVTRYHWLTEWQSRGVPHLHGCMYFDNEKTALEVTQMWLSLAFEYGAQIQSQNVKPIFDDIGWYKYLSKHCVRGVIHYQRNSKNIPREWQEHTGRMWGKGGDWCIKEPDKIAMDKHLFYKLRRMIKSYRKAKARTELSEELSKLLSFKPNQYPHKIRDLKRARTLYKCNNRCLSEVRGGSEFISPELRKLIVYFFMYHVKNNFNQIEIIEPDTEPQFPKLNSQ